MLSFTILSQMKEPMRTDSKQVRGLADTIGFAHTAEQMEMLMRRIGERMAEHPLAPLRRSPWHAVIAPHDDYTYVGELYPEILRGVTAPLVILFGVAHTARQRGLENVLLFDSFTHWHGPYGDIPVSPIRNEIMSRLSADLYRVDDEMQSIEHSVEAIVPFLQHFNRGVEIVSILVPAMPFERMELIARQLGPAIAAAAADRRAEWGRDYAIVISNDAVHYGDEEWGGRDFARFGTDVDGYRKALELERQIIDESLTGRIDPERVRRFTEFTLDPNDFREYRWTWCGRYSVPFGLLAAFRLQQELGTMPLSGELVGYRTSIDGREHIAVDDIGMGVTAPAGLRHWVGYAGIGYSPG
jgi:AmmeMemoRadiSam system protein B